MFCKKIILKNFPNFTEKSVFESFFVDFIINFDVFVKDLGESLINIYLDIIRLSEYSLNQSTLFFIRVTYLVNLVNLPLNLVVHSLLRMTLFGGNLN